MNFTDDIIKQDLERELQQAKHDYRTIWWFGFFITIAFASFVLWTALK